MEVTGALPPDDLDYIMLPVLGLKNFIMPNAGGSSILLGLPRGSLGPDALAGLALKFSWARPICSMAWTCSARVLKRSMASQISGVGRFRMFSHLSLVTKSLSCP
jgi:hypothetical protein